MAADPETLARFEGKPLLGEEGMAAVDALLTAHVEYDEAERLHTDEITELDNKIQALEAQRDTLINKGEKAVSTQHKARHSGVFALKKAVEDPEKNNNPVYATVIKGIESDGQGGLWYPNTLEAADAMGHSLVAFDAALQATHKSQPALVINRENSGHVNVYAAETKRRRGLEPSTITVEEHRGYRRFSVDRVALALSVPSEDIVGLQIYPNTFGREDSLGNYAYGTGPDLRQLGDAFKMLLPYGNVFDTSLDKLGKYDLPGSRKSAEIKGKFGRWLDSNNIELAVGARSVKRALDHLRLDFAKQANDQNIGPEQQSAFDQLTQLAMGEIELPEPTTDRAKRVATSFSAA